jgi:LPXTG-motif cell wall-anchored protein
LPFTGFNIVMIAGLALASILLGVLLVMRRRAGDEA